MRGLLGILVFLFSFGAKATFRLDATINISDRPAPSEGTVELLVTMDGILVLVIADEQNSTNRFTSHYMIMNYEVAEVLESLPISAGLTAEEYEHFICAGTISGNRIFALSDCVSRPL